MMAPTKPILMLCCLAATALADSPRDYIAPCTDEYSDFSVKLGYDDGTWELSCARSYYRCATPDASCAGGDSWTTESWQTFDYLETRAFYVGGRTPRYLYVEDTGRGRNCARALYRDRVRDFALGPGNSLDVLGLGWWGGGTDPVHVTVVPFTGDSNCSPVDDIEADRSLAVWLSVYEGQSTDPNDGSVYCDLSVNPEDCLNVPYWGLETFDFGSELVYYGTLTDVMRDHPPDSINIYIPEGYDVNLPITNLQYRFLVADGYHHGCHSLVYGNDPNAECLVDNYYESYQTPTSYEMPQTRVTISGLGRITGYDAFLAQYSNAYNPENYEYFWPGSVLESTDFHSLKNFAEWKMSARLVDLAAMPSGSDGFALDVSGVEVAWPSRFGISSLGLNNGEPYGSAPPSKLYDVKYLAWNDRADGPPLWGEGSYSSFTYTQAADDNIKLTAAKSVRKHATILQGSAGCAVNLGAYGAARISDSLVDGVYIHRITHSKDIAWNGCVKQDSGSTQDSIGNGQGGIVCTRSCALDSEGLVDATVANVFVPDLGGANSVARPFAIGVNSVSVFCKPEWVVDGDYHISNLEFKYFDIQPKPGCDSVLYDNTGQVAWGDAGTNTPSVTFYGINESNPDTCDFQGAVGLAMDPSYFVCGYNDDNEAAEHCMNEDGIGGEGGGQATPNIDYSFLNEGVNVNIKFPSCDLGSEEEGVVVKTY